MIFFLLYQGVGVISIEASAALAVGREMQPEHLWTFSLFVTFSDFLLNSCLKLVETPGSTYHTCCLLYFLIMVDGRWQQQPF